MNEGGNIMENAKGYKAFAPGMICRGKQYAENTDYEEAVGAICGKGMMHYCVNPFDTLNFYDLVGENGKFSDFAEVEALDPPVSGSDGKFAAKKLHIGAKLSFAGFVKACIDYTKEQTIDNMPKSEIGTGDSAQIGSSGDYAKIGSSGYYAQIGSSGNYAKINSTGEDSVICCAGSGSVVKAKAGSWITLAEWEYSDEKGRFAPRCVKTEYVDGEKIKADTWYRLKNGEFEEVR
jgi:hypothetical protein